MKRRSIVEIEEFLIVHVNALIIEKPEFFIDGRMDLESFEGSLDCNHKEIIYVNQKDSPLMEDLKLLVKETRAANNLEIV